MLQLIEIDGDRLLLDPEMVLAAMEAKVKDEPACLCKWRCAIPIVKAWTRCTRHLLEPEAAEGKLSAMKTALRPLFDRVVLAKVDEPAKSAGGIVLPETAKKRHHRGRVLAVGGGFPLENGQLRAPVLKEGDVVIFDEHRAEAIEHEGQKLYLLREHEVSAVVN